MQGVVQSGADDYRYLRPDQPELSGQFQTGQARHGLIRHQQVKFVWILLKQIQCCLAVAPDSDPITVNFQQFAHVLRQLQLIIHHQHMPALAMS